MPLLKEILPVIRAKHGNQSEVAKELGISSQLLGQYERGEKNPKLRFYRLWKQKFNEDVLQMLDDEPNVSRGTENGTPVKESDDSKEKQLARAEVYQKIVEGHTEYFLIPKAMLDEYEIISKNELTERKMLLEATLLEARANSQSKDLIMREKDRLIGIYERDIKDFENDIKDLEKQIRELKAAKPVMAPKNA